MKAFLLIRRIIILIFVLAVFVPALSFAGSQQTSGVTAQTIVNRARALLNESTASFWNDSEMLVWVNDAVRDLSARTQSTEGVELITLVSGQTEYLLSSNYITVTAVQYANGTSGATAYKGLLRGNRQMWGNWEGAGEPTHYDDWNGHVGIFSAPSSAVSGNTLVVCLISRPSAVTLTGEIPTPAIFDHLIVSYVIGKAYYRDSRLATGAWHMNEYKEGIERFRRDFVDIPRTKDPETAVR